MYTVILLVVLLGAACGQTNRCQKFCLANISPVCGTDHHTYSNMCHLQIAECNAKLTGHHLTLAHTGRCTSTHLPPISINTHCDTICDDESSDTAVCATDGTTYASHCDYENARCMAAKHHMTLSVRHTGQCTQIDLDCPSHCSFSDLSPVCTVGNHTYRSMCYLKQLQCRYVHIPSLAARYELDHNGSCDGLDITKTQTVDCKPFESHAQIAVEGGHTISLIQCTHTQELVCGADLHTHFNPCYYCRQMDQRHKLGPDHTVEIIAENACPSYLTSSIIG